MQVVILNAKWSTKYPSENYSTKTVEFFQKLFRA